MHSHIKSYCRWNDTWIPNTSRLMQRESLRVLLERNDGTFGSRGPWFSTASGCLSNFLLHFGVAMKPWLNTVGAGTAQLWTRAIRAERALYISASAVSWLWSFHDMCAVCMATASSTAINCFSKARLPLTKAYFLPQAIGWNSSISRHGDSWRANGASRLSASHGTFGGSMLGCMRARLDGSKCMWTKIGAIL